MKLQNQNSQSSTLIKDVVSLYQELSNKKMDPQQIIMQGLSQGKISKADLDKAIQFANSNLKLFHK